MKRLFIAIFAVVMLAGCDNNDNHSIIYLRNPHQRECVVYVDNQKIFETRKKDDQRKIPAEWENKLLEVRYGSYELADTLHVDSIYFDFNYRYIVKIMKGQSYVYKVDK
jgi:hypothetical protein